MRIAILTSGILPIPAVQGGAVENLIDFYLEYNQIHKHHDITVYSTFHHDVKKHPALLSDVNHYRYIKVDGLIAKVKKHIYKLTHKEGYYFYTIEYYIDQVIKSIRKEEYDIILIENRPGYVLKLTEFNHAKIVYHLHNAKIDNTTPQYKQIYDAASLIICVSDFVSKEIKATNPYDKKTITVLNGIDLKAFNSQRKAIVKREELGFKDEDFIIAYNGKMNPEKVLWN